MSLEAPKQTKTIAGYYLDKKKDAINILKFLTIIDFFLKNTKKFNQIRSQIAIFIANFVKYLHHCVNL